MKITELNQEKKFLTREEFNSIIDRLDKLISLAQFGLNKENSLSLTNDMKNLIAHVLNADEENDQLIDKIKEQQKNINLLSCALHNQKKNPMSENKLEETKLAIDILREAIYTVQAEARCSGDCVAKVNLFDVADDIKKAIQLLGFEI